MSILLLAYSVFLQYKKIKVKIITNKILARIVRALGLYKIEISDGRSFGRRILK